jgi:NADP-dependent 3-hydroxy acid dehydrogenase YdfG
MAVTSVEVQDRLVSRMMVLWSAKLEKVEVLINNTGITLGDYYRCLSVEEVEAWTGRIKKSLLPITDVAEMDVMDEELDGICGDDSD